MNKWEKFRNYINSYNINDIITRKNITKNVCGGHTIDNYINLSKNCGFLKPSSLGKYCLIYKIPNNFTSVNLKKMAYCEEIKTKTFRKIRRKMKLLSIYDAIR